MFENLVRVERVVKLKKFFQKGFIALVEVTCGLLH